MSPDPCTCPWCCPIQRLVATYFLESSMTLGDWLRHLHAAGSSEPLDLPEWCDEATFATLRSSVSDDAAGTKSLQLLDTMHGEAAAGGLPDIVLPPSEAGPDLAMVLDRSTLMLTGCKLAKGSYFNNFALTDVNKLWTKYGSVLDQPLHESALCKVASGPLRLVRVAFQFGQWTAGGVTCVGNEVRVVISPRMAAAAFAGVPWADAVERLLRKVGITPHVDLLADAAPTHLERHVHGLAGKRSSVWASALVRLRAEYSAADAATSTSVAGVVGIIDTVVGDTELRNCLFQPANVGMWRFGQFVFDAEALIEFTALKKGVGAKPPQQPRRRRKRPRRWP